MPVNDAMSNLRKWRC